MDRLIGRFFFKREIDGNINGLYSNNNCDRNFPEKAVPINPTVGYIGEYNTFWLEGDGNHSGTLRIGLKPHCNNILTLIWEDLNGSIFFGEGLIVPENSLLIGDYRNFHPIVLT